VDGMFVCLDRIVMSTVWQMLPQGGFGNAAAITVMESLHEQDQSEERCIVASFSRDVADTLLTGQHCCLHYMPEVLVVTRCNDGPLQTSFRVPHKMKLVVVRSMLGRNTSYVSAEVVKSAVCPGEDFVDVALLGILVTACIVAEQDLAHNAVIPGRLKMVARRALLGVADWAGCVCSRFGSNQFEEQRWATRCKLGDAAADGSACHSFHEAHHRDAVTPWCHEAGVNLLQYGERFTEPVASEFDAAIAAVNHEAHGSVTDRLEGSGHRGGTRTVTLQVHSIADTLPASLVASTAGLACCAKDSRYLPCGGFLRHPPDTKSAPLLDEICTVRRWGLDTGDLKVPFLPAQTVALSVVKSLSPELSRFVTLPSCAPPSPALVAVMVLSHRALLTHACIRSAGYTATWDAQLRLGGTLEPAPQIAPHTCIVAVNRVNAVMTTLLLAVALRIDRDVRTVGIVNKSVGALAVLNHEGKFSVACSRRLSDRRSGIYVVTFYIGTVDNALWVMQNEHLPRAGSLRRVSDAKLALLSNVFSVQWRLGRYASNFSLAGIPRLTAPPPVACKKCVVSPYLERCGLASQLGVAACLCQNAGSLAGPAAGTHDGYFLGSVTMSDSPVGANAGGVERELRVPALQYPLRMDPVAVNPVRADTTANHQPEPVLTCQGDFSVACTAMTCSVHSFLSALVALLTFATAYVRVMRRGAVQSLVRVRNTSRHRCDLMNLALYMWMLCGISLVRARGDVDFTTWAKPGQGLEVWGALDIDDTGYSVADAGDVNKDGFQDILVGAHYAGLQDAGAVYLVFGSPGRTIIAIDTAVALPPKGIKISGATAGDIWGISVSGAGDVNKDGIDDFIIGGYQFDPFSRADAGGAVVIFGKTSGWADIDLSSFTSGTAGFWIWGAAAGDYAGWAVSGAGDVNGDGASDVIVGARLGDPWPRIDSGAAYVIFGHSQATAFSTVDLAIFTPGSGGFSIFGAEDGDQMGYSVGGARDVNGDGFDDVIVGAKFYDGAGGGACGAAYVIFGHSAATAFADINLAALSSNQGFRVTGAVANAQVGYSVSTAGDFNHDGYDDIVLGSQSDSVYVLFGHANTTAFPNIDLAAFTAGTAGFVVSGSGSFGWSVSGGVDINKDGVDDVAVVAPWYLSTGVAYVLYGRHQLQWANINVLLGVPAVSGYRIIGAAAASSGDWCVSLVKDFDGDGVGDILLGAPYADFSGRADAGTAYLVYGELSTPTSQPTSQPSRQPSARPTSSPVSERSGDVDLGSLSKPRDGLEVLGALAGDNTGRSVVGAGDINKDGYQDVLVGSYTADVSGKVDAGAVYVVFGFGSRSVSTIDAANALPPRGIKISGVAAGDLWGWAVGGAGDFNKDGIDDFVTGGLLFDSPSRADAGGAVVIFGKTSGWADIELSTFTSGSAGFWVLGAAPGDQCGDAVSGAGDVNGDGVDDVIIGAHLAASGTGVSYVIFGHTAATAFTTIDLAAFSSGSAGFKIIGFLGDSSGEWLRSAGDVNGDGYGDIVSGTLYYDGPAGIDCGAVSVIFGHSIATAFTDVNLASLSGSQGFRVTGAAANDKLGRSVSSAGDFNHDGYCDIVVGSYGNKAAIIFGHSGATAFSHINLAAFTPGSAGFMVLGSGDLGQNVGGGVDINGDGIDDVAIAAATYSTTGVTYVLYGRVQVQLGNINLPSALSSVTGFSIIGATAAMAGGWSVALIKDFNGDGVGDIVVGAPFADVSGRTDAGIAYVVYGELSAPTSQPSGQPTGHPSRQPTGQPTRQPTSQPSMQPSRNPTSKPTTQPSRQPSSQPSRQPTSQPSRQPSRQPTTQPSRQPTSQPSGQPSARPTSSPVSERSGDVDIGSWSKPRDGLEVWGAGAGNRLGDAVGSGDFNKDGYQDVLLGAHLADLPSKAEAGVVYVLFGSPSRSASTIDMASALSTTGIKVLGAYISDLWGVSVSGAGDVNRDGIDDFIIGGYGFDPPSRTEAAGAAAVIFGKTSGWADIDLFSFTSGSAGFWIYGAAGGDHCGISVSGAGDVNGDGAGDVIVGCNWADRPSKTRAGTSYVVFGHSTSTGFVTVDLLTVTTVGAGYRIDGANASDSNGEWVAGAGDVNGDGYDDIITTALYYDRPGSADCGAAYVIFGHGTATAFLDINLATLSSSQGFRITGAAANDRLGWSASSAGDFNHDGYGDIVIGSAANRAYVLFGHSSVTTSSNVNLAAFSAGSAGFMVTGSGDFGVSVSGGVDVNRDGIDDIVVAAPGMSAIAVAYVLYGHAQTQFVDINVLAWFPSVSGFRIVGDNSGWSVSLVRDFDGDGVGDVLIGARYASPSGRGAAGQAFVVYGELSAPTSQPSTQPTGLPSRQPTSQPSRLPSTQPSRQPSVQPTSQPSSRPTGQPTGRPSRQPTLQPSGRPTSAPSRSPARSRPGSPAGNHRVSPQCSLLRNPVPSHRRSQHNSPQYSRRTVHPASRADNRQHSLVSSRAQGHQRSLPVSRQWRPPLSPLRSQAPSLLSSQLVSRAHNRPASPQQVRARSPLDSRPLNRVELRPAARHPSLLLRRPPSRLGSRQVRLPVSQVAVPAHSLRSSPLYSPAAAQAASRVHRQHNNQRVSQAVHRRVNIAHGPRRSLLSSPLARRAHSPRSSLQFNRAARHPVSPLLVQVGNRLASRVCGRLRSPHNSQQGSRAALLRASRQHYPVHNQRDNQRCNPPEYQVHSLSSNQLDNQVAHLPRSQPRSLVSNPRRCPLHSRAVSRQSSLLHSLHISPVFSPRQAPPRNRAAPQLVSPLDNLPRSRAVYRPVNQPCSPPLRLLVNPLCNRRASPPAHHLYNPAGSLRAHLPHSPHRPQPKSLCRQPL
jgi:hypothetical protein